MSDLLTALGLVLVIEGLLWALAPGKARQMALEAAGLPEQTLRLGGTVAVLAGVFIVWLIRG